MVTTLVAIGTFILGLVLGALGGVYYLRNKMQNMTMSDTEIATMAKGMGMNLNQKQLAQIQRRMKNAQSNQSKTKATAKKQPTKSPKK
ncbi:YneF family protein [Tumebacillus sp. ITR2]|uniref:YneF family protein n=1 Tax=Tumebacillus amylolyticus TaxID=2801339 RepID=A0ABS1JF10_9BACL|nr:YneF family protein [Tumebacillus amylolyticus]MBL0388882.1 YneF family protein [Tumebacillus amylolyticus]